MDWQSIVALIIVAIAAIASVKLLVQPFFSRHDANADETPGCSSGCGSCGKDRSTK
jgi:hypothetical protein